MPVSQDIYDAAIQAIRNSSSRSTDRKPAEKTNKKSPHLAICHETNPPASGRSAPLLIKSRSLHSDQNDVIETLGSIGIEVLGEVMLYFLYESTPEEILKVSQQIKIVQEDIESLDDSHELKQFIKQQRK